MPLLAIAAVTAVVVAGTGAPALASPSDVSEAEGQLLTGGGLIDINGLAALAPAYSATPSGAAVSDSTLNLTAAGGVLGGINLNLGSGVQLPAGSTLANLLDIGVDGQHAATSVAGVAHAASGALTQAGTIDTSAGGDATKDSTVTLTPLLSAVPGASNIATDLTLQLGAIAAQADETGGASSATGAYEVSGGTLTVTSPLVSQLDSSLSSTLSNATATLNSALGSAGAVSAITGSLGPVTTALSNALSPVASVSNVKVSATVDTVDLSNVLATIGTVTSNGVSINLANGTISVDLGTLLGNGDGTLNGLPANTHLLTGSTVSGLLNGAINAAITALINQVDTAVTNELDGTNVNVVLTANVSTLVIPLATLDLKATGTVGQLLSGTPPFTVADNGSNLLGIIPVGNLITAVTTPLLDNVLPVVGT
ncbi:MAG: choice-of-anchor G family protein, partial [Microbacteriaceae bacterium]|nr:choice-of-anchor G family protein [Microbacteriaceae bacterium]